MILTLTQKIQETSDVYSFIFQPDQDLTWQAGQYLRYTLPHDNPDDRGINRYFTISAAPYEKNIRLTTRFDFEHGISGTSSFKKALFKLEVGQTIEAKTPSGDFTLTDSSQHYIFIAGGIGITPFRSIILDLKHRQEPLNIHLIYGNRNQEIVFKQELDQIQTDYIIDPDKIDQNLISKLVSNLKLPVFYVSGPEPMVESLGSQLLELGVPEDHLKQDFFPGYLISD